MNNQIFVEPLIIEPILSARELRTLVLFHCLEQNNLGVTLTLNLPGIQKSNAQTHQFFNHYYHQIIKLLKQNFTFNQNFTWIDPAGAIGYFLLDAKTDPRKVKQLLLNYEDSLKIPGQLLDLDVYVPTGVKVSRHQLNYLARKCFLCDQSAKECAVKQVHSQAALQAFLDKFLVIDSDWTDFEFDHKDDSEMLETIFYEDFFKHFQNIDQKIVEDLQVILSSIDPCDHQKVIEVNHLMDQVCLILSQQRYNLKKAKLTDQESFLFRFELLKNLVLDNLS